MGVGLILVVLLLRGPLLHLERSGEAHLSP
jgi:hypothetical protein